MNTRGTRHSSDLKGDEEERSGVTEGQDFDKIAAKRVTPVAQQL